MSSADNLCKQFGPRSGPTGKKVNFEKSRPKQKHEKLPSRQSVKNASNHTQTRTQLCREPYKHTVRHTHRHTDRHIHTYAENSTDRHTDRQTHPEVV